MFIAKQVIILIKYSNYADVFSKKLVKVLSDQTGINKHAIKLEESKQLLYKPIYSLEPVELEIFKNYIETNLANGFMQPSKLAAEAVILFVRKPNGSLYLCVNYQKLNNLTIKNRYLLPLINELLDGLSQGKCFIQLNFTSAYH